MTPVPLPLPDVVPVLRGTRVVLRPPLPADVGVVARLGVDPTIERFFGAERGTRRGLTSGEARAALARLDARVDTQGWVIERDGRLVGLARLFGVELAERRARYAITFLAREHLGHGMGTEATRLVLTYAFAVLGLHRVTARVLAFNERALACFRACAFSEEGRERESVPFEGYRHDVVLMGVLDREFAALAAGRPECAGLSALARVVRSELAQAAVSRAPAS
ncbi:MAG TPA: GNAT family protein [Thermoleophilia bacterium]|nr:GNAT family protein [Thermoleophilia bacterium]